MKLLVNNPCGESWDGMSPKGNGRHCSACEKVVVDFTKMSDEEVMAFFNKPSEAKVCGRFNTTQLNRSLETDILLNQQMAIQHVGSGLHLFGYMLFLTAAFSLASCNHQTTGEVAVGEADSVWVDTAVSGNKAIDRVVPNAQDSAKKGKNCNGKAGVVPAFQLGKPRIEMGEVEEQVTTGVPEVVQLMGDTVIVK